MTARFTFAVCVSCGTQSPPILLNDDGPIELSIPLAAMGWRFDKLRFNVCAHCPNCLNVKKTAVAETA